jgi:hypothetical protein
MKFFNRVVASVILTTGLSLAPVACIKNIPLHPGAVNPVDNALYDGILTTRAAIESAKVQFQGVKATADLLNTRVIPPFNKLEAAYIAYHTALVSGKSDPAALTSLQTELAAVKAALVSIVKTAPPVPVK